MNKAIRYAMGLFLCLLLAGCAAGNTATKTAKQRSIPFEDGQSYAVAYLGYQNMDALAEYAERYLDTQDLPIHYISAGDYYLVIPRYTGMTMQLYQTSMETMEPVLIYSDPDAEPFLVQCNVSDIVADTTIQMTYQGETVSFSPFISLKDGTVDVGENGLNLAEVK